LINGKRNVGSAVDFRKRMISYYSLKHLASNTCMAICRALKKFGHSNFGLEILEYCEPSVAITREQYYLDLLYPEYNILKIAGSSLGRNHSEVSRGKISAAMKGIGKGIKKSVETKAKMSASKMANSNSKIQPNAKKIVVTDLELDTKTTYPTIRAAARAINLRQSSISNYLASSKQTPFKNRYIFTIQI
jgi:group I intron endonuclease